VKNPKIIFPSLLSSDELGIKMDEWELRDCDGILDYNTIKVMKKIYSP
jgi:hypothetical protein